MADPALVAALARRLRQLHPDPAMTGDVCAICEQPLGDSWPHYPHDEECWRRNDSLVHFWYPATRWVSCSCPTLPVHPECCPCTPAAGILDRIDRNQP